jgi:hypothetical protein
MASNVLTTLEIWTNNKGKFMDLIYYEIAVSNLEELETICFNVSDRYEAKRVVDSLRFILAKDSVTKWSVDVDKKLSRYIDNNEEPIIETIEEEF